MKNKQFLKYQMFTILIMGILFILPIKAKAITVQCKEINENNYTCTIEADEGFILTTSDEHFEEIESEKKYEGSFNFNPGKAHYSFRYREHLITEPPYLRDHTITEEEVITQEQQQQNEACNMYNRRGSEKGKELKSTLETNANSLANCTSLSACSLTDFYEKSDAFLKSKDALVNWINGQEKTLGTSCNNFNDFKNTVNDGVDLEKLENSLKSFNGEVQNSNDISQHDKDNVSYLTGVVTSTAYNTNYSNYFGATEEVDIICDEQYGEITDIISKVFGWIQIIAPLLLVVFGLLDFGKATIANDQDALKKATSNFVKRAIAAVLIFFLPLIVNTIFKMDGIKEIVGDKYCDIVIKN